MALIRATSGSSGGGSASCELITITKGVATELKENDIFIGTNWSSSCYKPTTGKYTQLISYTGCFICQMTANDTITIPSSTASMYYILRGCSAVTT